MNNRSSAENSVILRIRQALRPLRRYIDIRVCRRRLQQLPPDSPIEDILAFALTTRAIKSQQIETEIREFAEVLTQLKPKIVIEIGTSRGGTLFILSRLAGPGSTIISIDRPGAGFGEAYSAEHVDLFKLFPPAGQQLHVVSADSHDPRTVQRVRDLLKGQQVDLLFIDGDHTHEGVKADFEMFSPLVSRSGMIAFHDIAENTKFPECQVKPFWDSVKLNRRYREIVADPRQGWAGIGVLLP